ncbi:MAG: hypothetical protein ACLPVF_20595 [Acidimicrobiales bacterium]
MSALPAQITEPLGSPGITAVPLPRPDSRARVQADRRVAQRAERRSRRRWALGACAILVAAFAFTVGILDVLH